MAASQHKTIHRYDYTPPDHLVDTVELKFELGDETTLVFSRLTLRANYDVSSGLRPLVLDGQRLVLRSILVDGRPLPAEKYEVTDERLTIHEGPDSFTPEINRKSR